MLVVLVFVKAPFVGVIGMIGLNGAQILQRWRTLNMKGAKAPRFDEDGLWSRTRRVPERSHCHGTIGNEQDGVEFERGIAKHG